MSRTYLVGSAGHGNLGDDFIAYAITSHGDFSDIMIMGGALFSPCYSQISQSRIKFLKLPCDRIVIGGGGLLNDNWSLDYLLYFTSLAIIARIRRMKVAICGVGAENLQSLTGRLLLRVLVRCSHLIYLRDEQSKLNVRCVTDKSNILVSGDLAWLYRGRLRAEFPDSKDIETVIVTIAGEQLDKWAERRESMIRNLQILRQNEKIRINFLPMQVSGDYLHNDLALFQEIAQRFKPDQILSADSALEVVDHIRNADLVYGYRMHASVIAALHSVPSIIHARSSKISGTLGDIPIVRILNDTEELRIEDLIFIQQQYEATNEVLDEKVRIVMNAFMKATTV
jgi:polysaccharide pyruvyl transferase WcaK-like protein